MRVLEDIKGSRMNFNILSGWSDQDWDVITIAFPTDVGGSRNSLARAFRTTLDPSVV